MTEETIQEVVVPAWTLQLQAKEILTLYQALRVYLQALGQQPDPPLDSLSTVVELLRVVKPAAVEAAAYFQENHETS